MIHDHFIQPGTTYVPGFSRTFIFKTARLGLRHYPGNGVEGLRKTKKTLCEM